VFISKAIQFIGDIFNVLETVVVVVVLST